MNHNSNERTSQNKYPDCIDCIVVYFDIFGFSSLIAREEDKSKLIQRLLVLWEWINSNIKKQDEALTYLFSDGGFIIYPIQNKENSESIILQCTQDVELLMNEYLKSDFFLRGGVSCGPIHFKHNLIVGEAVINAVRYESHYCPGPYIMFPIKEYEKLTLPEHLINKFRDSLLTLKSGTQMMQSIIILPLDKHR